MKKKHLKVHFSSETDDWATPPAFFNELNKEFQFNLDVCASLENAKCHFYFDSEMDGLAIGWSKEFTGIDGRSATVAWCNPPYGRTIGKWIAKASAEAALGATVVMLLPARTDTKYFHQYIYNKPNVEIRFIKGRLKFGNAKNSAPFPSMVVVFRSGTNDPS